MFGASSGSGQYNYFGGIAQAICLGPVKRLYWIKNGDTFVWSGPIDSSSADGDGKTVLTTTIGTINFYWGTATQHADPILAAATLDLGRGPQTVPIPGIPYVCYAVGGNIAFGSQTSPPILSFELEVETSVLSVSGHTVETDDTAVLVEADASGDTITEPGHRRQNGSTVTFEADSMPSGLTADVAYYVVNAAPNTYQVSATFSGSPINFTTNGTNVIAVGVSTDGLIPEIIYEWLTNKVYGRGVDTANVNATSFSAACETIITEGLGVSPVIDSNSTIREIIGKLLEYINGVLRWKDGKIELVLIRAVDTSGLPTIGLADMLDEPKPTNEGSEATWNKTAVSFTDRENAYEGSSEPYDDPANAAALDEDVLKVVNLPFIKMRGVAKKVAKRIGVTGGMIPMSWKVTLKPKWCTLAPGDLFFTSFAKTGFDTRLVRVTQVSIGTPEDPTVEVTVTEEMTRDTSHDYEPPADLFGFRGFYDDSGANTKTLNNLTTPRLSWIPSALKGEAFDGFLVASNRPDSTARGFWAYWTYDPLQMPYQKVASVEAWPAKGTLLCWHRIRTTNWLLRVQMDSTLDYNRLKALMDTLEVYAVVGERLVKLVGTAEDQHQTTALWNGKVHSGYQNLLTSSIIDIEISSGKFGTDALTLETVASPAKAATQHIYFGAKSDFLIFTSDVIQFDRNAANAPTGDTDLKRHVKTPVWRVSDSQTIDDVTDVSFDRDDTTMCPNGTYSRDWGARARTTYEVFDTSAGAKAQETTDADYATIQDFDQALGDILGGTPTDTEHLLADDIDTVLGQMVGSGNTIYNDSP